MITECKRCSLTFGRAIVFNNDTDALKHIFEVHADRAIYWLKFVDEQDAAGAMIVWSLIDAENARPKTLEETKR